LEIIFALNVFLTFNYITKLTNITGAAESYLSLTEFYRSQRV